MTEERVEPMPEVTVADQGMIVGMIIVLMIVSGMVVRAVVWILG